jgi:hypothetical protein
MIGHELRQVSLCSAAQAVLSTLSTQWRHSPRFSRPLGATGPGGGAWRRGGVGRQGAAAAWPARREIGRWRVGGGGPQLGFGVTGRANQAAGGAAALPVPVGGRAGRRAPACTQAASGARALPFNGQRPAKGPAGPMEARFMRPRKRLAHVPTARWHQAPAHGGQLGARAGPGPGQSRASLG